MGILNGLFGGKSKKTKCTNHNFVLKSSSSRFDYYECSNEGCCHSKGVHKTPEYIDGFNVPDEEKPRGNIISMQDNSMPSSTLEQLDDRHHAMAAAQTKKELEQFNWQINPNDIGWMFLYPRIEKNMGRSARVFYRLQNLERQRLIMLRFLVKLPIHAYRRWLSPRKGFKCAHHALHQSGSCSDRVLGFIENKPLLQWPSLIKNQFSECKQASIEINNRKKRRKCDPTDMCESLDCIDACNPFD